MPAGREAVPRPGAPAVPPGRGRPQPTLASSGDFRSRRIKAEAQPTAIGNLPADGALDTDGLDISDADRQLLLSVDTGTWQDEADHTREYFTIFGSHLPGQLWDEHEALLERLKSAS